MTQKELLYYEDAIGHEVNTIDICNFIIENLDDDDLKAFMKRQLKKHEANKKLLLSKMEELANE